MALAGVGRVWFAGAAPLVWAACVGLTTGWGLATFAAGLVFATLAETAGLAGFMVRVLVVEARPLDLRGGASRPPTSKSSSDLWLAVWLRWGIDPSPYRQGQIPQFRCAGRSAGITSSAWGAARSKDAQTPPRRAPPAEPGRLPSTLRSEIRLSTGRTELCSAALRDGPTDRFGPQACLGRANCSATQAKANQAEVIKASHNFPLASQVSSHLALHTKNMEYSGCGSSWVTMARPIAMMVATMPSIRSVLLSLAGLRLPAGS
jgi:hypothetical protein